MLPVIKSYFCQEISTTNSNSADYLKLYYYYSVQITINSIISTFKALK